MATTRKPSKPTAAGKPAGLKTAAAKAGKRAAPPSTRMTPQTSARASGALKPAASKVAAKKAVVAKKTTKATVATKVIPKKAAAQPSTGARKTAPAPAPIKTASVKPSPKPTSPKPAAPKPASFKPATAKPAAAAKPSKPKVAGQPQMITADQALANTRALLQAKQAQAQQPTPYPTSDPGHHVHGGFMSHNAAETNQERHFDEANSPAIQGHVAAQVRSEQGKRDKR